MADTFRTDSWLQATGPVQDGYATAWDNHGNSSSGFTLTCAGKKQVTLNLLQWYNLGENLGAARIGDLLSFDGEVHIPSRLESPLQHLCRKIEAEAHHAPHPVTTRHRV